MKTQYFTSSLVVAASGLAASSYGQSDVVTLTYDETLTYSSSSDVTLNFGLTSPTAYAYYVHFPGSGPVALKPQLVSYGGTTTGLNEIFLNSSADDDHRTLPVLTAGTTVGAGLTPYLSNQGFFFQNWNQDYYGDWGGTGGTAEPSPIVGPITGYVGLAIPTSSADTDFNYGYAHFSIDMTQGNPTVTLLDTGYEPTVDQAITIPGAVPEPSSIALLAAGATGLLALRRRRALR